MVAALVGLLLDPERYDPMFPGALERPEDALARILSSSGGGLAS